MSKHDSSAHVVKGPGLARGPALIVGTILAAFGLILFLHAGATPTGGFPDGDATGSKFLGFEANGWTAFFTTAAGAILLFAAAQHLLAKTLGLIVGLALAACVILDLVNGPGVLGLAAANWATDLGWAIAAVVLLLNVFAPRVKHTTADDDHGRVRSDGAPRAAVSRGGDHDGRLDRDHDGLRDGDHTGRTTGLADHDHDGLRDGDDAGRTTGVTDRDGTTTRNGTAGPGRTEGSTRL
jgi:hypothetical protein